MVQMFPKSSKMCVFLNVRLFTYWLMSFGGISRDLITSAYLFIYHTIWFKNCLNNIFLLYLVGNMTYSYGYQIFWFVYNQKKNQRKIIIFQYVENTIVIFSVTRMFIYIYILLCFFFSSLYFNLTSYFLKLRALLINSMLFRCIIYICSHVN